MRFLKNDNQNSPIPKNLGLLFQNTVKRFPNKKSFGFKTKGGYCFHTWTEFQKKVYSACAWLESEGIERGDRVALFSENRPEWAILDLAAQCLGAVTVPIYTSLTSSEIEYLLTDSGCKCMGISGKSLLQKIIPIQKKLTELKKIVIFEKSLLIFQNELGLPLIPIETLENSVYDTQKIEAKIASVEPDTTASIIYTSGTTGPPKGVMLTHSNFIHNLVFSREALSMGPGEVHLSFLPLSHVFERTAGYYLMVYLGAAIAYAENMDSVRQNILEVKPTFLLGVPRFYEKIKEHVLETIAKENFLKKKLFEWAASAGHEAHKVLAKFIVRRAFKKSFGGRLRFCVSGGAALSKEIAKFFFDLGLMIYEGYGLTETSPVISANREEKFKFGTVGIPLNGVDVKISEEGEILTKSPCVMKGYYKKELETREVLKEGWFYTGDLGRMDADGFLAITGRKKELIVTSGGKKIAPKAIEEKLEKDELILRCVLFGEGQRFITALIVPRKEKILEAAGFQKIAFRDYPELLQNESIYRMLENRIETLAEDLASFEKIKYFILLPEDFSQARGEITPTLKVKREVVIEHHKKALLSFYGRPS